MRPCRFDTRTAGSGIVSGFWRPERGEDGTVEDVGLHRPASRPPPEETRNGVSTNAHNVVVCQVFRDGGRHSEANNKDVEDLNNVRQPGPDGILTITIVLCNFLNSLFCTVDWSHQNEDPRRPDQVSWAYAAI